MGGFPSPGCRFPEFLFQEAAERAFVQELFCIMSTAVRSHDEELVGDRFLLLLCTLFGRENGLREFGERVALAGEREGFVPAEGRPLHRIAHPFESFLYRFQSPYRSVGPGEIAAQVGVGIDQDGLDR